MCKQKGFLSTRGIIGFIAVAAAVFITASLLLVPVVSSLHDRQHCGGEPCSLCALVLKIVEKLSNPRQAVQGTALSFVLPALLLGPAFFRPQRAGLSPVNTRVKMSC